VIEHGAVVEEDGAVVPGRRDQIEAPPVAPPVSGALEPAQEVAVEQAFQNSSSPSRGCGGTA
jgi:hypothetical protein